MSQKLGPGQRERLATAAMMGLLGRGKDLPHPVEMARYCTQLAEEMAHELDRAHRRQRDRHNAASAAAAIPHEDTCD